MRINRTEQSVTQMEADVVVVGIYEEGILGGAAAEFDRSSAGLLSRLIERKEVSGKLAETESLFAPHAARANQLLVVGLGKQAELDRDKAFRAAAAAARKLAQKEKNDVAFFLADEWSDEMVEGGICGVLVGCHGQDLYRAEKKTHPFDEVFWSSGTDHAIACGQILGECVNITRDLVNEPPSTIYPESFARVVQQSADKSGLEMELWDQQRLEVEKCGSLLGVARGSSRPPQLVILRHHGGGSGSATLGLVGKGVTFDSGGLSLKPSDSMKTMKCDMAGAATVVGAMLAIARLQLPVNVIGLLGLVENMVSGDSYKLGDILTARNGKTIEVLNTDAEGRLVLADVLDVTIDQGAAKIIDLATLTGACVVALGTDVAGLMTNDQAWCDVVAKSAKDCGEQAWQLPMFDHFAQQIKSEVADIKNIGEGRWGGAITAAKFLEEFVREIPWVHIDIAGPSFLEKPKPWLDAGGSGAFVRTLVEVARHWNS